MGRMKEKYTKGWRQRVKGVEGKEGERGTLGWRERESCIINHFTS